MSLLDQPFGWAWLLVIGWTAYRLLISALLATREAATLGRGEPKNLIVFHLLASAVVWAIFGAVGWRTFFDRGGVVFSVCFGGGLGFLGLVFGFIADLVVVLRMQHRLAVRIVAGRAATFAEQLDLGDLEQRVHAAQALAFIGPKAQFAVPQLLAAWKDRDPQLRSRVAIALGTSQSDDPAVVAAMREGTIDVDSSVRLAAAWVLVHRKAAELDVVLPILRAGLSMDEESRNLAGDALTELGPAAAPAVPELVALIGEQFNDNALARYVLEKIGEPAVSALIPLLRSPVKKVRDTALDTLGAIGPEARAALPEIRDLLHDPDKGLRLSAQRAIAKIEGKE